MSSNQVIQHLRKKAKAARTQPPMTRLQALYALRNAQRNVDACLRIRREISKLDG